MMMLIGFTYKNFTLPENPEDISINKSKNINTRSLPGAGSAVDEISGNAAVINVSGRLYGEDREVLAAKLSALHDEYGAGALYLPGGEFFYAYFSQLKLKRNAAQSCIFYELIFVEDEIHKNALAQPDSVIALSGENAFDIASRCGVPVERIVEKNSLKTPFDIEEGQRLTII